MYCCSSQAEINQLVSAQPKPTIFFKTFLELDGTNMVSILSFDSRSLKSLLDEKHEELFDQTYPLFYRNKIQKGPQEQDKYFYRNAVDIAVKFDQA